MEFYVEKCTKNCVEDSLKNAVESGLYGTLSEDVLERLKQVRVQTRSFGYFRSFAVGGEYQISTKKLTISRNCPLQDLGYVVLHEGIHMLEYNFHRDDLLCLPDDEFCRVAAEEGKYLEFYKNELNVFLSRELGKDYDVLQKQHCLFAWGYDRRGANQTADALCSDGFVCGHGDLFWQMSLRVDVMLGWPLGTTMGYGAEEAVKDLLAGSKEVACKISG